MKSFLCGDFGAGTLKIAEFEPSEAGSLRLKQYVVRSLGLEGAQDASRSQVLLRAIQEALESRPFGSRHINICTAGFNVFSKFVKLPPVDTAKVTQIIQYEAQQNVPFPLEEVVWDYQILGAAPTGELEVLLVAIKSDIVENLFRTAESAGLRLQLVDVSPAALCNAFRFNYGDEEGCTMLLDIGAKTSNLLFFEKGKVFSRSINIGANAITQDFANEARLTFPEAEQIKIAEGFVGLGGAYAEPDKPHQAQISKISRQVMTRLHIQMNQTIQFYRGQQGGSAPQRLYLAGGASLMPYTAQFFAEKLNIPVDYFNPLRNVEIDEGIDLDALAPVAHTLGEVVGLSIRNLAQCPVELNLMPRSYLKRKQFDQKKPYFIAAVMSLVLVVAAYGLFFDRVGAAKRASLVKLKERLEPLQQKEAQLRTAMEGLVNAYKTADEYVAQVNDRLYWGELLNGMRSLFIEFEAQQKTAFGVDTGVWIEGLIPLEQETAAAPQQPAAFSVGAAAAPLGPPPPKAINYLQIQCRAVNLLKISPDANSKFTFALEQALKTNELFGATYTKLSKIDPVEPAATNFTFGVTLQLKRGIKAF